MLKSLLTLLFSIPFILASVAQERCGTEKFDSVRRAANPKLETKDQFEKWMATNLALKKSTSSLRTDGSQATYVIPVVVHVIHNGQPIGTGFNISDAQVLSQIKVLNNDFQRLNTDASQTPTTFQPVAGAMSVEFVLAKQNPKGEATNGIVRVNGGKAQWQLYEDTELKSKSYWPAEQYFNVWVTNFPQYLGYTQFPVSNLPGLNNSSDDRLTDGIIAHYRAFGSVDDGLFDLETQYNKGRTVTHEVGHFLGLRHIWGDGSSCSASDFVDDTPPQVGQTNNCPTHPRVECSSQAKMFQNYLDYTDDQCMNIFTKGQVSRMEVVLQNSPRRKTLLTSPGALPPGNFSLDLGIMSVEKPTTLECSGTHTPTITIRNFGTTTITQANIELKINGIVFQTKAVTPSLGHLQQTQITFNNYVSAPSETQNFQFQILTVNGTVDEYGLNNTFSLTTMTSSQATAPFVEKFESAPISWNIVNPDGLTTWQQTNLGYTGAMFVNNFNYEQEGAVDKLFSPAFDVSAATGLLLKFKLAYAQYPGSDGEALSVYAITNCTDDLSNATRVFFEEGDVLSTTDPSGDFFAPQPGDWQTKYVPLNQFIGATTFRLAFVNRNGYGNNVYIDSVHLTSEMVVNLAIQKVLEPSMAVCESPIVPKLKLANLGTSVINGFTVALSKNGVPQPIQNIDTTFDPGAETEISLSELSMNAGGNDVDILVTPNGPSDSSPVDNAISMHVSLITNAATIPVRENFNSGSSWSVVAPKTTAWVTNASTNYEKSAAFMSFDNPNLGEESWLVSPKLDFSNAVEARLFADFSYGYNSPNQETIIVAYSENCGKTFAPTQTSIDLSDFIETFDSWVPDKKEDWVEKSFDLNELAGKENILIKIQAKNFNGNNLYVDNIEFFEDDNTTPAEVPRPFRVWQGEKRSETYLTFNLEDNQTVHVQVASMMGNKILDVTQENTLNQTLTLDLDVVPGIYIFRVFIDDRLFVVRHYMGG
jgi:Pregnancy-associated plasma protein-A